MPSVAAGKSVIGGRVQGVGFRPFVYHLAHRHDFAGSVRNGAGIVEVLARGPADALRAFAAALIAEAPAITRPRLLENTTLPNGAVAQTDFLILPNRAGETQRNHVLPDYYTCPDCLIELGNPANRRYRYPFINCAQCGPRHTLIRTLPYDRPATSMADFPLCRDYRQEYENPFDRRFHAEPVACPACSPHLTFCRDDKTVASNEAALTAVVAALRAGAVIAIKGVGATTCCAMHATRPPCASCVRARHVHTSPWPCSSRKTCRTCTPSPNSAPHTRRC